MYTSNTEINGFSRLAINRYCKRDFVDKVTKGCLWGGNCENMYEIIHLYNSVMNQSVQDGYIGTDESLFTIMVHQKPELFHLLNYNERMLA